MTMMKITFSPVRSDAVLHLEKRGATLVANGADLDFSQVSEEAPLALGELDCPWLVSDVTHVDGDLHLTLLVPHGPGAGEAALFPEPLWVRDDGIIPLPGTA